MSYQLKVIKDYPIGFWPLDESSGSTAADISGCGNNGTYHGSPATNILPIIPGGVSGTKITNTAYITLPTSKDFYGSAVSNGLANKYSSDNDFTLEVWIHHSIESSDKTTLFADPVNNIGLFWEDGDILFQVSSTEIIRSSIPYSKKALHLVAVYSVGTIRLFIDGKELASKVLDTNFKFTNSTLNLQIGPTENSGDTFIVDAPAVYRYSLKYNSIARHYNDANFYVQPIHVVDPDDGILFSCSDIKNKIDFEYVYGVSRSWKDFVDQNTYYDNSSRYLTFYKTDTSIAKSLVIDDFIMIPSQINLTSSKIEWRGDLGISVQTSIDGTNYINCLNGQAIPQYKKSGFNSARVLYIRITMSTPDASKFLPKFSFFGIRFYKDKTVYADNKNNTISSNNEYALGSLNYSPLMRSYINGIRPESGYGFNINTTSLIKTVEMFFTPSDLSSNTLFYDPTTGTKYAWNGSGTVSKASISKFYVNGVDKTSQTNISNFLVAEEPHHIVLVFDNTVTGSLQFNYQTSGGIDNLYNNIAIYEKTFTNSDISTHYDLYVGRPAISISEPVVSLTELETKYYDSDYIVIQTV